MCGCAERERAVDVGVGARGGRALLALVVDHHVGDGQAGEQADGQPDHQLDEREAGGALLNGWTS